mmetsp:Transcript_8592/g.21226  ORF Transcript_8592/g.21226 Transcript_8592/m.21226 type:complete len:129 (+) Transcript_8592:373-759(+)
MNAGLIVPDTNRDRSQANLEPRYLSQWKTERTKVPIQRFTICERNLHLRTSPHDSTHASPIQTLHESQRLNFVLHLSLDLSYSQARRHSDLGQRPRVHGSGNASRHLRCAASFASSQAGGTLTCSLYR